MTEEIGNLKMTVEAFFEALASNQDFIYAVAYTNSFKKDVKRCYKQNLDLNELFNVIVKLAKTEELPPRNRVHSLTGFGKERVGEKYLECHISPDWLLIWVQKDNEMILVLTNTGTHSDLF
jgi:mRNA interferase YafQ